VFCCDVVNICGPSIPQLILFDDDSNEEGQQGMKTPRKSTAATAYEQKQRTLSFSYSFILDEALVHSSILKPIIKSVEIVLVTFSTLRPDQKPDKAFFLTL
jgi:hypothetical protein